MLDNSSSLHIEFNFVNVTLMKREIDDKSPGSPIPPSPLLYSLNGIDELKLLFSSASYKKCNNLRKSLCDRNKDGEKHDH